MDARIVDYIRVNRRRYTREAITQQLLEAGYSREAIEATWAVLDTPDPDATAGEGFWRRFWLYLIGANLVVFLAVGLLSGMLGELGSSGGILAVILAIALAIGGLAAWGIVAATGPTRMERGTALAIGAIIPLAFALLIGGTCYALVGGLGVSGPPTRPGTIQLSIDAPLSFAASGPATCAPQGGASGYSVSTEQVGAIDGRPVTVTLDAYPGGADASGDLTSNLTIYLLAASTDQQEIAYANVLPDSKVELDPGSTALSGSLLFTNLTPVERVDPSSAGPGGGPISGTLTWQCE